MPLFSIITITYNSKAYLEETIRSVLDQDFADFEYLLVDGGSTDGTLALIEKYAARDRRIRWLSEPDKGIADAMNKGIRMASGDIVAHLHSDDLYLPDTLARVAAAFQANPTAQWATGRVHFIDASGTIRLTTDFKVPYTYDRLLRKNLIVHPATFVRRPVFTEAGLFDPHLKYAMDYDLWLRIAGRYEALGIDAVLACFRSHAESLSSRELLKAVEEEYAIRQRYDRDAGFFRAVAARLSHCREKTMIRLNLNDLLKRLKQRQRGDR
jgi:glycosyltransferase involved in cell wall biosynthesis